MATISANVCVMLPNERSDWLTVSSVGSLDSFLTFIPLILVMSAAMLAASFEVLPKAERTAEPMGLSRIIQPQSIPGKNSFKKMQIH